MSKHQINHCLRAKSYSDTINTARDINSSLSLHLISTAVTALQETGKIAIHIVLLDPGPELAAFLVFAFLGTFLPLFHLIT